MDWNSNKIEVDKLIGKTLIGVTANGQEGELHFEFTDGVAVFGHVQNCCESVYPEDYDYALDASGKIFSFDERFETGGGEDDSYTWSFYTFTTQQGHFDFRFTGESNGFYSESVDIEWRPVEGGLK